MEKKQKLIVLTGPTAVGKTKLSIALAKAVGGEIISADSMQVYKHMDIGSAKIMPEEMEGVPHYLVDELEPNEEFHVVQFQKMAKQYMEDIYSRGHIPILVGGTGFYIQSVIYDIDFSNTNQTPYRKELEELGERYGNEYLHNMLKEVDPESADNIHANNQKRVIRALEFYKETGSKISQHNEEERQKQTPYDLSFFVLTHDRKILYDRIDQRVDKMVEDGLVDEVRKLQEMGYDKSYVSMQGLGYKEILDYLEGVLTLEEAIYLVKRDTRHFAKRQLTWFRRERDVIWVDKQDFYNENEIVEMMVKKVGNRQ